MGVLFDLLNSSYEVNFPYRSLRNRDVFTTYLGEMYSLTKTSYGPELFCKSSLKSDKSIIANFLRKQQLLMLNDPRRRYLVQDSVVNVRKFPILKTSCSSRNTMFFTEPNLYKSGIQPVIISRLESTFNILKLMFYFKKRVYLNFYDLYGFRTNILSSFGSRLNPVFGAILGRFHKTKRLRNLLNFGRSFSPVHLFKFNSPKNNYYFNYIKSSGYNILNRKNKKESLFLPELYSKWRFSNFEFLFRRAVKGYVFPEYFEPFLSSEVSIRSRLRFPYIMKYLSNFSGPSRRYGLGNLIKPKKYFNNFYKRKTFKPYYKNNNNSKGFKKFKYFNKKKFYSNKFYNNKVNKFSNVTRFPQPNFNFKKFRSFSTLPNIKKRPFFKRSDNYYKRKNKYFFRRHKNFFFKKKNLIFQSILLI